MFTIAWGKTRPILLLPFKKSIKSTIKYNIPDFIQVDHPVYVEFVEAYYKYLESSKIIIDGTNFYLTQETNSVNYVLDENSENILLETVPLQ